MVSLIAFKLSAGGIVYINPAELCAVENDTTRTLIRTSDECSYKIAMPLADVIARLANAGVVVVE